MYYLKVTALYFAHMLYADSLSIRHFVSCGMIYSHIYVACSMLTAKASQLLPIGLNGGKPASMMNSITPAAHTSTFVPSYLEGVKVSNCSEGCHIAVTVKVTAD
jgi:hypothetical protein